MAIWLYALAGSFLYFTFRYIHGLTRNIAEAKKSGFTYVVVPFHPYGVTWRFVSLAFGFLYRLCGSPQVRLPQWCVFLNREWAIRHFHQPFAERGSDVILVVSPFMKHLFVADADAQAEITSRVGDFPKPMWIYRLLNIYGDNLITTEGATWRQHKKITLPSFAEKNYRLVWEESLHQVDALMVSLSWRDGGRESDPVADMYQEMQHVALRVISRAGFGVRAQWEHEESEKVEGDQKFEDRLTSPTPPAHHKINWATALKSVMFNYVLVMIFPEWILNNAPIKSFNRAGLAKAELGLYMNELFEAKKDAVIKGDYEDGGGMDLLGELVRGAGIGPHSSPSTSPGQKDEPDRSKEAKSAPGQMLSDREIVGNAFLFFIAGFETTACTLSFALINLATHPSLQRSLQRSLSSTLSSRPPSTWTYQRDFPLVFGSPCSAVVNETLRLFPPVSVLPKMTRRGEPQPLTVNGKRCVVPAATRISVLFAVVHRNPQYWPPPPPPPLRRDPLAGEEPDADDAHAFRPERWEAEGDSSSGGGGGGGGEGEHAAFGADEEQQHGRGGLNPRRGAFNPFSLGQRSCIGRRFAQVELMAVLASLLTRYSVELVVDDDNEGAASSDKRRAAWERARAKAQRVLREELTVRTATQLKVKIPLRFVKRGYERYDFDV